MPQSKKFKRIPGASPLSQDGYGNSGIIGRGRAFFDSRSFPEIMSDWRKAVDPSAESSDVLLMHLGLSGFINADQLSQLVDGRAAAGDNLLKFLKWRLDATQPSVSTGLKLYHVGKFMLNQLDYFSGAIELSDEAFSAKRKEDFLAFAATIPPPKTETENADETIAQTVNIDDTPLRAVITWLHEHKPSPEAEVTIEAVEAYIKSFWQQGKIGEISNCVAPDDFAFSEALNNWAEIYFQSSTADPGANKGHAGMMLKFLRTYNGLTRKMLGEKIGVTDAAICHWELGISKINPLKLGSIIRTLGISEDEAACFSNYVRPEIAEEFVRTWFRENRWEHLNYPALDMKWLEMQDESKRFGLLLRAWRLRKALSIADVASTLGITNYVLVQIENGGSILSHRPLQPAPLSALKLGALIDRLGLNENESKLLVGVRLPALDPEFLSSSISPENRSGHLIRNIMELAGVEEQDLRNKISRLQLGSLNGNRELPIQYIPTITAFLMEAASDGRPGTLTTISPEQRKLAEKYINHQTMAALATQIQQSNAAIKEKRAGSKCR